MLNNRHCRKLRQAIDGKHKCSVLEDNVNHKMRSRMRRIKDMIIPFRSCRKWTTAAVLGAARKGHATAPAPLVASSDEEEEGVVGATPAPHIVLKMHLHCASCAAKIERVVMDVPGMEKVATDVEANRVTVTGTADAAAVATSVQVRTRKPITVVSDGRSAQERRARTARTPHGDQVRVRGRTAAEEIAGRQAQEQAAEWTAEVRVAGLDCGRCVSRIVQRVRFQGAREIKLTLPERATTRCRRSSSSVCDNPGINQQLLEPT